MSASLFGSRPRVVGSSSAAWYEKGSAVVARTATKFGWNRVIDRDAGEKLHDRDVGPRVADVFGEVERPDTALSVGGDVHQRQRRCSHTVVTWRLPLVFFVLRFDDERFEPRGERDVGIVTPVVEVDRGVDCLELGRTRANRLHLRTISSRLADWMGLPNDDELQGRQPTALRQLVASGLLPVELGGKSQALAVVTEEGIPCVVKPREKLVLAPLEYALETYGTLLAGRLGIPTPQAFAVRIDVDLANVAPKLKGSTGLVFGSRYLESAMPWPTGSQLLPPELREAAASLFAFDLFVHNPDRKKGRNPNLFQRKKGFVAYDYEQAFGFAWAVLIGAPPPETDPLLDVVRDHVFAGMFGQPSPDRLDHFKGSLGGLSDSEIADIAELIPKEWRTGADQGKIEVIVDVLKKRRMNAAAWLPTL